MLFVLYTNNNDTQTKLRLWTRVLNFLEVPFVNHDWKKGFLPSFKKKARRWTCFIYLASRANLLRRLRKYLCCSVFLPPLLICHSQNNTIALFNNQPLFVFFHFLFHRCDQRCDIWWRSRRDGSGQRYWDVLVVWASSRSFYRQGKILYIHTYIQQHL